MKFCQQLIGSVGCIFLLGGSRAEAFMTHLIPGHEYLTLFALEQLQNNDDPLIRHFYGTPLGNIDYLAHPLFEGNTLVDFPGLNRAFGEQLLQILLGEAWDQLPRVEQEAIFLGMVRHDDNYTQVMNFTRNYLGIGKEEAVSAHTSCTLSQNFIKEAVLEAVRAMAAESSPLPESMISERRQRKQTGLKFVGAALHTLQDSFSKAHTKRHSETWLIEDVCSYRLAYLGRNLETGLTVGCVHTHFPFEKDFGGGSLVVDDQIWNRGQADCEIHENGRLVKSFACLKDETQMAVVVTRDFLVFLVPILNEALWQRPIDYDNLETALTNFLRTYHPDPALMAAGQGIMGCDRLADFSPHTHFDPRPPEVQPVTIDVEPVPFP
ncbi:hypothetical protein [Picosynechococcus sp. NKBG15041c]|uniref:hypothetical protein n=1 Tax=Picosynechococcus sp. NKBG15041c TaxID=1407650 RepID=UPI00041310DC|nr:hypothetical protein [Picosynechococcus sp. NKBG15041c]